MIRLVLLVLVLLWLFGSIDFPWITIPSLNLFVINGQWVTLRDILVAVTVLYAVKMLPSPFKEIVVALALLWLLSTLGIIAVSGFSNLALIALIVGIGLSLLKK